ncbi:putative phosphatidylglycerol/phosphatidylinositol transfer protein DDB_G0282179 [Herrania umbratica]|uniref:Phosphatidylglycerol/phosphatidylinositol transfer protein DDB_G0282179 n=1 Tax=Herrania umbratica TaxID=108875 RepID=A0A6J0ZWP2_9ROSI|nr:putative phosphatidylglycerol/phosphatidylinositol transfer protein DDB_G0282179 [Herrania umbratica]
MELVAQFKLTIVLFFTIFSLLAYNQAQNVTYCDGSRHYAVNVQKFEVSPDPMLVGRPATFTISASTSQPISDGRVVIDVSFLGLHVHTETRSLCEEASCPIAAGNFKLSHSQTLPVFTPPGSYALQMILNDQNNLELTCIGINFTIGTAALASDI